MSALGQQFQLAVRRLLAYSVEKLLSGRRPKLLVASGGSRLRGPEGVATFDDVRPWWLLFRQRARVVSIVDRMRVRRQSRRRYEYEFFNRIGRSATVDH